MSDTEIGKTIRGAKDVGEFVVAQDCAYNASVFFEQWKENESWSQQVAIVEKCRKYAGQDKTIDKFLSMNDGTHVREQNPQNGRRQRTMAGYVYLLKSGESYKIGHARNVTNRMLQIKPAMPHEVVLVDSIYTEDRYELEASMHEFFADKRLNGEWFNLSDSDVEMFKSEAWRE